MTGERDTFVDDEAAPIKILEPGVIVAERYRIIKPVGQGGMGIVYKAEHIHMDKLVALKMMIQETTSMSADYRRFQREAQAASLLNHPNIVAIHDFGFTEGQAYLCMDYLEGQSLEDMVSEHPLTLDQFRHIFKQACDALQHAHEKGIVHRDIKPSNLMITERRGDKNFLVILDFGLVKLMESGGNHKLTATNMVVGSPFYMSPEQCRGSNLDQRSDIYSLGCVMYESLARMPPFVEESIFDLMNSHISKTPKDIREVTTGMYIPPALDRVVLKALAKTPEERPQSMKELSQSIDAAFSGAPDMVHASRLMQKSSLAEAGKSQELPGKKRKRKVSSILLMNLGIWLGVACLLASGIMVGTFLKGEDSKFKKVNGQNSSSSGVESPISANANTNAGSKNQANGGPSSGVILSSGKNLKYLTEPDKLGLKGSEPTEKYKLAPIQALGSGLGAQKSSASQISSANPASSGAIYPDSSSKTASNSAAPPDARIASVGGGDAASRLKASERYVYDGTLAFSRSNWSQARSYLEAAIKTGDLSLNKTEIYGKLAVACYKMQDTATAAEYLNRFKDLFRFNSRSVEGDPMLLWDILTVARSAYAKEDYNFSERLAKTCLDSYRREHSSPDRNSVTIRMELSRIYADQGKPEEARSLLQESLREATFVASDMVTQIKSHLAAISQGAPQGAGSGFQPLPGAGFLPSGGSMGGGEPIGPMGGPIGGRFGGGPFDGPPGRPRFVQGGPMGGPPGGPFGSGQGPGPGDFGQQ